MQTTQRLSLIASVFALGLAGYTLWQITTLRAARRQLADEQHALQVREARLTSLQKEAERQGTLAQAVETDNASLRAAIASFEAAHVKPSSAQAPVTSEGVKLRYHHARELAKAGKTAEALKEFLWCYDVGMRQVASFAGVRQSYVLDAIRKLGPEGTAALQARREAARQDILEGSSGQTLDFGALNRVLGEPQATVALYDELPAGDGRRRSLAIAAYQQFVAAQRYTDAMTGRTYASMSAIMEIDLSRPSINDEVRNYSIHQTATNVEVLAGSGDLEHAKTLAARLVHYDSSDATKTLLREHLQRAGHAELLDSLPTPATSDSAK